MATGESPYVYGTILEDNHVRLFRKISSSDSPPVFEIREVSLDQDIPYIALSYTWNSPLDTEESRRSYENVFRDLTIAEEDGPLKTLRVQRNLWEAIQTLTEQHAANGIFFWADSICIHQANLAELASQVRRMARVFSRAKEVVVWLGNGFKDTSAASVLWTKIAPAVRRFREDITNQSEDSHKLTRVYHSVWTPERLTKTFGYDLTILLDVFSDFIEQHRWYHRIWVIPEFAVARSAKRFPTIMWQGRELDWLAMDDLSMFIFHAAPFFSIDKKRRKKASSSAHKLCAFKRQRDSYADAIQSLESSVPSKRPYGHLYRAFNGKALVAAYLAESLRLSRRALASNPRDCVFFTYGLASELYSRLSADQGAQLPVIDYKLSLRVISEQAMSYLIQEVPSLAVLGFCQLEAFSNSSNQPLVAGDEDELSILANDILEPRNPAMRQSARRDRHREMPSWVPNFMSRRQFYSISPRESAGQMRESHAVFPRRVDDNRLTLTGISLGCVQNVCILPAVIESRSGQGDPVLTLDQLRAILVFIVQLNPNPRCSPWTCLQAVASTLVGSFSPLIDRESEYSPWGVEDGAAEDEDRKNPNDDPLEKFVDLATVLLARSVSPENEQAAAQRVQLVTECHEIAHEIKARVLASSEYTSDAAWISAERTSWLKGISKTGSMRNVAERVTRNTREWHFNFSRQNARFKVRGASSCILFATEDGFVGMGRTYVKQTDKLWIIGDCPFPVILRPIPGSDAFKLVSPTWVHGVMEGELMTTETIEQMRLVHIE